MNIAVTIPVYKPRQKRWFVGQIGQQVFCEATKQTPASVREKLVHNKTVADEKHAQALYVYHRDYKVNFTEIKK